VTRTPVSTNGTFSSIPKKGTCGLKKKKILPDSFPGGPREYYTEKWLKNSKKNSLVLAGLYNNLLTVEPRAVDPHCFDADPDPDPAQNLDAYPDSDPDPGGGGGRSAKNVHPP
jgi:hypothetical protein